MEPLGVTVWRNHTFRALKCACLALFLAACTTTPEPVNDPRQVWCDFNEPRRDATPDTPRTEIDEINAHNRRGELWCGWQP